MVYQAVMPPGGGESKRAAGSSLPLLELLLGAADAPLSGHLALRVFGPADELVSGERRDVVPRVEGGGVGDQRIA